MISWDELQEMLGKVRIFLKEKEFDPPSRTLAMKKQYLRSEVVEIFQEYKRHGFTRPEKLMEECAGTVIRALNYWYEEDMAHLERTWTICNATLPTLKYHKNDPAEVLELIHERISVFNPISVMRVMALTIYWCEYFAQCDFRKAFEVEYAKIMAREPRFNTHESHWSSVSEEMSV